LVSKHFRYIYLLVVFNFFFLLERGTKRKEREGKKKFSLSSLLFSLLPFFHSSLLVRRLRVATRRKEEVWRKDKGKKR